MVIYCAFSNCTNKRYRWAPQSFHVFPVRDRERTKLWLIAAGLDINTPAKTLLKLRTCSDHFRPDDFEKPRNMKGHPVLTTNAVPSVFPDAPTATDEQTATYEESCTGITFAVSEFTFDEENECSNEQGGEAEKEEEEEEEEIDDFDSDWEMEDSNQLESDNSDKRDSELPKLCPECGAFVCLGKPHTCEYKIKPVCGKRSVNKRSLKVHSHNMAMNFQGAFVHASIHKESYEHPCKFCMAPFETRLDKLAHESTHIRKAKPHECPDCPMTFSKLPARNLHLKVHRAPKIFSCPYCALKFPNANHMDRHIVVHSHTDMKEFVCEFCSRSFSQPGHLESHLRVHTGEKPYQCQHCDKSFNHNVSLKSHLMRYHERASSSGPSGPMKPNKKTYRRSLGRPKGRPQKTASEETNSNLAVQREVPDPITAADTSEKGHLRKASSKDIESEWSYKDPTSELTEGDKGEETKGMRKGKREAGQRPKTYCIAEEDFESDLDSNPSEQAKERQVFKSQDTGRRRGRPRKNIEV